MTSKKKPSGARGRGSRQSPKAKPTGSNAPVVPANPPKWWSTFILGLVRSQHIPTAAADAGVARQTAHEAMATHPDLKEQADEAFALRQAIIRKVVFDSATEGVKSPCFAPDGETIIGYEMKRSDKLLLALARAELPEFREAFSKVPKDNGPVRPGMISVEDAATIVRATAEAADRHHHQARPAQRPAPAQPSLNGSR